jgi:hypothetical protein
MQDQRNDAARVGASRPSDDQAYAVLNTVRALERLAVRPQSVPEIAAALEIGERSARRLLKRLAAEGYAEQGRGRHRRAHSALPPPAPASFECCQSALSSVRMDTPCTAASARRASR